MADESMTIAMMTDTEFMEAELIKDKHNYLKSLYRNLESAKKRNHRGDVKKYEALIADFHAREKKARADDMARFKREMERQQTARKPTTKVETLRPSFVTGSDIFVDGTPVDIMEKTSTDKARNIENYSHLITLLSDPSEVEDSIIATFNTHKHPTLWEELDTFQINSIAVERRLVKFLEDLHKFLTRCSELLDAKRGYYAYITAGLFNTKKAELEEKITNVADAIKEASEKLVTDAEEAAAAAARAAELEAKRTLAAEKSLADATDPKRAEYVTLLGTFAGKMRKDASLKPKADLIDRALTSGVLPPSTILTKKMQEEVRRMGLASVAGLTGGKRRTQKRKAKQSRKQTRRQ